MTPALRRLLLAWGVPVATFAVGTAELFAGNLGTGTPRWVAVLLLALFTLPFGLRARRPLLVTFVAYAAGAVGVAVIEDLSVIAAPFVIVLLGAYTTGAIQDVRRGIVGLGLSWVLVALVALQADDVIIGDFIFPGTFAFVAWAIGRVVRQRTLIAAELHEQALRADEDREEAAARAVADERRRIAREMHDVVAHSVSVMVVQAGGARRILEQDPERAVAAAAQIELTGRGALAEMRHLLSAFAPDDMQAAREPQPGLGGLDALVRRAEEAGLDVTVRREGEPRVLPSGLDLAAYRVVQEGLTNVVKHASPTRCLVVVRWGDDALELRVADAGPTGAGAHPALGGGGGHGIIGMRERVQVFGGDLHAGPRPGGGFELRAVLPLADAARAA